MGLRAWFGAQLRAGEVLSARQRMFRAGYYFASDTPALAYYLAGASDLEVHGTAHMFSMWVNGYRATGIDARPSMPISVPHLLPATVIDEIMAMPIEEFCSLPPKLQLLFVKTPAEKAGAVSGL